MRAALAPLVLAALACSACGGAPHDASGDTSPQPKSATSSAAVQPAASGEAVSRDDSADYNVLKAKSESGEETAIAVKAPEGWTILRAPDTPDPHAGKLTLAEATQGLDKTGTLAVHFDTSMGSIYCDLFEKDAPNTVANFVGLARGKRKFWDVEALAWVARPYYHGTAIHRVMPGFMMQGGDHTGTGKGGIGYTIPDEIKPGERADRPGLLFSATRGPNTGESQFFITTNAAPHIDGKFTKFGECSPVAVVDRISRVPNSGRPAFKPLAPVVVRGVEVRRLPGGRMKWLPKDTDLAIPGVIPEGRAVQVSAPPAP